MSFFVQISETLYAVNSATSFGVFAASEQELEAYSVEVKAQRVKYTDNPGKQVGTAADANTAHEAAMFRAQDQVSPESDKEFDDGDGYSRQLRWLHTCHWTKNQWYCERTEKISNY